MALGLVWWGISARGWGADEGMPSALFDEVAQAKSSNPERAREALEVLIKTPRSEAEEVYVASALKDEEVCGCLEALRAIHSPRLLEVCDEIKSWPLRAGRLNESYTALLEAKRAGGWSMPDPLVALKAMVQDGVIEQDSLKIEQGRKAILAWPDRDEAELVALELSMQPRVLGRAYLVGYKLLEDLGSEVGDLDPADMLLPSTFGNRSWPVFSSADAWKLELQPGR